MSEDLVIHGFKLFQEFVLKAPGQVNLVVGENNVGKTALLEALYLEKTKSLDYAVTDIMHQRKESGLPAVRSFVSGWFSGSSPIMIGEHSLSIIADHFLCGRNHIELALSRTGLETGLDPVAKNRQGCLAIWQSGLDEATRDSYWDELVLTGGNEEIAKSLQLLYPELRRIGLKNDGHTTRQPYFVDASGTDYPLGRLGQGMQRILGLAFGLHFCRGGRLLIDEFETGFHYSVMPKVWRWFCDTAESLNVEVFATTHSLDCVNAFAALAAERKGVLKLYRLDRKFGPLRAVGYDEEQLEVIAEEGVEVR